MERLFDAKLQSQQTAIVGDEFTQLVLLGGFPEAIGRESERRRQNWSRSYFTSLLTRALRDNADVKKLNELPKFLRLVAKYFGQLVNFPQCGAGIDVSHKAGKRYVSLLEQVFLIATVQP